ncbi:hypothetical protein AB6A40_005672 [Gnathostoma spinigerum]|uniref:Cleavage/polyadenylation specificity factor A subunit N-terminal domain-containing protein n=1 Tax=Gnathostoma spinigerum TaxID=75299 RepID=A0ABD6EG97_9BILA
MYAILRETDDSTSVNFSECGKFLPGTGLQLVTVGGKFLRFFQANPFALRPESDHHWTQTTRLECILSQRLLSPVRSLAVARIPQNPNCDCLLLGFDDAKLSVISVDPSKRSLKTHSLHCFEDEMIRDGYVADLPSPTIRVDPGQRCAAMLVYGRYLAILPFDDTQLQLHTYTVALTAIDTRLMNVVDMVFLDGYYEPTLLFLYEPVQTTVGRASIRYDTICILGVSFNVKEQVHASVWQLGNLPMDLSQLTAIPRPIGGALLIGVNELVYLNQSVPPCGISLNSCLNDYTKFPLKDNTEVCLALDGAVAAVISPNQIVLAVRDGRVFLVQLVVDATNSVKSVEIKPAFEMSVPHTLTACSPGYLFVGSRLGDSVFVQYSMEKIETDDPLIKKNKTDVQANDVEDEDVELYGQQLPIEGNIQSTMETELKFRILDSLLNIAPCKKMTTGCPDKLSPHFQQSIRSDPLFDLVTASGHEKDGSICIFQRSIRPDIITSSSIEGVSQYWAAGRREDDSHKYIIAAKEFSTLVLETDSDLVEIETPIFLTSETTIAAGELADGSLTVQITESTIVLVAEDQQIQQIPLNLTFPARSASIVDPFIAICSQNGRLYLYELTNHPYVHLQPVAVRESLLHCKSPITALSLYRDMSGFLRFCSETSVRPTKTVNPISSKGGENVEDLDDLLLYGLPKKAPKKDKRKRRRIIEVRSNAGFTPHLDTDLVDPNTIVPSHWLTFVRENGNLYIYSVPEMQMVYIVKKFTLLPDCAVDEPIVPEEDMSSKPVGGSVADMPDALTAKPEEIVVEILLFGMGMNQSRPLLFVHMDDSVSVYEMFAYDNGVQDHLAVRFKKLPYNVVTRSSRFLGKNGRTPVEAARDSARSNPVFHPFERIGTVVSPSYFALVMTSMKLMTSCRRKTTSNWLVVEMPGSTLSVLSDTEDT